MRSLEAREIELRQLKKLKKLLMEYSSGISIMPFEFVIPIQFVKRYRKDGWKLFEDPAIDAYVID